MTMPVRTVAAGTSTVPVVDLEPFLSDDRDGKRRVARQIRRACEGTGFFYLAGHGVPSGEIDAVFAASKRFFALPLDERMKVKLAIGKNRGYQPLGSRMYGDQADAPDLNESFKYQHELPPTIRTFSPETASTRPTNGRRICRAGARRCSAITGGWSGSPMRCCVPSRSRSSSTRHTSSASIGSR